MIYQYDLALPLPTKDLYDTLIMQMAIAAAKDMYDKGEKRILDFYDKYADFYSPISGATEDVYNTGIGAIKNKIDEMYANGIDPLRTMEGRAMVAQAIRGVDIGKINRRKQEAELAKQYLKNRDVAIMNGTYNPDVERAINGKLFEEWTADDGYWTATAPVKYMSQDDMIAPLAKSLTPEFDAIRTARENNGYDYKTVSEDRIRQMVNDNIDDLIGKSTMGQYYYNQALKAADNNPELAKKMLADQYVQIAKKYTKEDRERNDYVFQRAASDLRIKEDRQKAALDFYYKLKEDDMIYDLNGDRKLDKEELDYKRRIKEALITKLLNTGRRGDDGYPNIFDEADRKPEEIVEFKPGYAYDNKISPNSDKAVLSGSGSYIISKKDMESLIEDGELLSDDGRAFKPGTFSTNEITYAIPAQGIIRKNLRVRNPKTGKMEISKKKYAYYMRVALKKKDGTEIVDGKTVDKYAPVDDNSQGFALIRIKDRDANYGEQQKKDKTVDTSN